MLGPSTWPAPQMFYPAAVAREELKKPRSPAANPLGQRGVVLLPAWRNADDASYLRREDEYSFLRKALLYWDVVCWPELQSIDMNQSFPQIMQRMDSADAPADSTLQILRDEGCLVAYKIIVPATGFDLPPPVLSSSDVVRTHIDAYLNLELREPGIWSLAQATDRFGVPTSATPITDGVVGMLANSLPAPAPHISYREIIAFRRQHRDSFLGLRAGIDELSLAVANSSAPNVAWEASRNRLELALVDVWKACAASKLKWYQSTLKIAIAALAGAVTGAATSKIVSSTFPELSATISSALSNTISAASAQLVSQVVPNPTALTGTAAYLYPYLKSAHDDALVDGSA